MRKKVRIVVALIISSSLCVYFVGNLDITSFVNLLRDLSIWWVVSGILCFVIQLILKAFRFGYILDIESSSWKKMVGIMGVYSILRQVLLGGLGEVGILYLFKRIINKDYAKGASSLFVLRTIDLSIFCILFIILLYLAAPGLLSSNPIMKNVMKTIVGVTVVLLLVLTFVLGGEGLVRKCLGAAAFKRTKIGDQARHFILGFQVSVKDCFRRKSVVHLVGLSVLIWIVLYLVLVSSCKAVNANLRYYEILLIFLIVGAINVLPIRGVGNLGTHELAWVVPLSLLGYSQSSAILTAFGTHAIFCINLLAVVILMLFFYRRNFVAWLRMKV